MYLGLVDFRNNQQSSDSIFGINPVMLRVSKRAANTYAIEDTKYLGNKQTEYCDLFQLQLFCDIVQLQYVGTNTYDTWYLPCPFGAKSCV